MSNFLILLLGAMSVFTVGVMFTSDDETDGGSDSDTSDESSPEEPDTSIQLDDEDNLFWGEAASEEVYGNDGGDIIYGYNGEDTLHGNAGGDLLVGGVKADVIYGDGGNDQLEGGLDNDTLYGGTGIDYLVGGMGDDSLNGGEDPDLLDGGWGNDMLKGGAGEDILFDARGADTLIGGSESDIIASVDGVNSVDFVNAVFADTDARTIADLALDGHQALQEGDSVDGGEGDDILFFDGGDTVTGGAGADFFVTNSALTEQNGAAVITDYDESEDALVYLYDGGVLPDLQLTFTASGDAVLSDGNAGEVLRIENAPETLSLDDIEIFLPDGTLTSYASLYTETGTENAPEIDIGQTEGTDEDDYIQGSDKDDQLYGFGGDDELVAGSGNDEIYGGADDDMLYAGSGDDTLSGGSGRDNLYGDFDRDLIFGDSGDDLLFGGSGADTLIGGSGNDSLEGGDNGDLLIDVRGEDTLIGDAGRDTLISVDGILANTTGTDYSAADVPIDQTSMGDGADVLKGGQHADMLIFDGGDIVKGGAGADTFVTARQWLNDLGPAVVTDYNPNEDTIEYYYTGDTLPALSVSFDAEGNATLFDDGNAVMVIQNSPTDFSVANVNVLSSDLYTAA